MACSKGFEVLRVWNNDLTSEQPPFPTPSGTVSRRAPQPAPISIQRYAMTKERLYLSIRPCATAPTTGVEFSLEDKIAIARLLDGLGIDYVEGGYPGANVVDTALFEEKRTTSAQFVAFGMTKRAGRSVDNDPGLKDLVASAADAVCFVSKAWDHQVKLALGISTKENLKSLAESIAAATAAGKEAFVDCEHFFDGYKANRTYASIA